MIATWMLYCSLCALGISVAAALAERALLAGRGPVRLVWIGAMALSLLVPAVAFRFAPRPEVSDTNAVVSNDVVTNHVLDNTATVSAPTAQAQPSAARVRDWGATLARFDNTLIVAWITLSLALAVDFFGGVITLAWMRRRWQRRNVLGVPVFVSERTGPAVVGALAPAIVLPEWVLALEPQQLGLMLRHEQEHRRAGDGRLLTAAQIALIAMPWNLALWWQILRLRVAVELDCDARVLQDADPRSYGGLLLEMARPRRGPRILGATAFAERATQLEKRIRVLGRHRSRTTRTARAMATCIGLAAVTVAWVAPHPQAPARAQASPVVSPPTATPVQPTASVPTPAANGAEKPTPAKPPQTAAKPVTDSPLRELPATSESAEPAPAARSGVALITSPLADTIFERLFEGITIGRDQEARARDLLARLEQQQLTQDQIANESVQANRARTQALTAKRDTALRALLTNDADRATFDQRVAQGGARVGRGGGGGRGARGGGGDADTLAMPTLRRTITNIDTLSAEIRRTITQRFGAAGADTARVARGGASGRGAQARQGGGAARGGGGGGRGSLDRLMADTMLFERFMTTQAQSIYNRFFNGISLTPEQEAAARDLIAKTQEETTAQRPQLPPVILRVNRVSGIVSMQAESAAELMALVSNEADRAKLQSRIVINQP